MSQREAATIVQAQIPVLVLHGRHDILAMPCFGEQLAHRSTHCPDRSQSVPSYCSAPLAIHLACQLGLAALCASYTASMTLKDSTRLKPPVSSVRACTAPKHSGWRTP